MKLKLYTALEDLCLVLWGLVLIGIILGENCPVRFLAETHPVKLLLFPAFTTNLFSRLRRREKARIGMRQCGKED